MCFACGLYRSLQACGVLCLSWCLYLLGKTTVFVIQSFIVVSASSHLNVKCSLFGPTSKFYLPLLDLVYKSTPPPKKKKKWNHPMFGTNTSTTITASALVVEVRQDFFCSVGEKENLPFGQQTRKMVKFDMVCAHFEKKSFVSSSMLEEEIKKKSKCQFLSPPVQVHDGLLCITFCLSVRLSVTGQKLLDNSSHENYWTIIHMKLLGSNSHTIIKSMMHELPNGT